MSSLFQFNLDLGNLFFVPNCDEKKFSTYLKKINKGCYSTLLKIDEFSKFFSVRPHFDDTIKLGCSKKISHKRSINKFDHNYTRP